MREIKVGDRVKCIRSESFLPLKSGKLYTVSKLGGVAHPGDMEYIQVAELIGCAYRADKFVLVEG